MTHVVVCPAKDRGASAGRDPYAGQVIVGDDAQAVQGVEAAGAGLGHEAR